MLKIQKMVDMKFLQGFFASDFISVDLVGCFLQCTSMTLEMAVRNLLPGIDNYAKDGGEELFTKMRCVL